MRYLHYADNDGKVIIHLAAFTRPKMSISIFEMSSGNAKESNPFATFYLRGSPVFSLFKSLLSFIYLFCPISATAACPCRALSNSRQHIEHRERMSKKGDVQPLINFKSLKGFRAISDDGKIETILFLDAAKEIVTHIGTYMQTREM